MLQVRELSHQFGRRKVLSRLSFEVGAGEVFGLLGPNGSGKSTVLSILTGALPRQSGDVIVSGQAVVGSPRWLRRRLGVVFQEPSLDPLLTLEENLGLTARMHGFGRSEARRRTALALTRAKLESRRSDRVSSLSGGLRRRLDIARALIHEPSLLIMDEPTSGLDEASFRSTWETLNAMRAETDLTVVVATHRPDEAEKCDRLAVLSEGRAALIDSPSGLKSRVAGDVVVLRGSDPEWLSAAVQDRFELTTLIDDDAVLVECEKGHELIPSLVEGISADRLESVSLRRPTLADAFLKLTGHGLDRDDHDAEERAEAA